MQQGPRMNLVIFVKRYVAFHSCLTWIAVVGNFKNFKKRWRNIWGWIWQTVNKHLGWKQTVFLAKKLSIYRKYIWATSSKAESTVCFIRFSLYNNVFLTKRRCFTWRCPFLTSAAIYLQTDISWQDKVADEISLIEKALKVSCQKRPGN